MWLTLLALRNRIGILMLSLAMVVLGATSLDRLPVDLFPNIQVPVAFVGVIWPGVDHYYVSLPEPEFSSKSTRDTAVSYFVIFCFD